MRLKSAAGRRHRANEPEQTRLAKSSARRRRYHRSHLRMQGVITSQEIGGRPVTGA
jgi:hypothetical protein